MANRVHEITSAIPDDHPTGLSAVSARLAAAKALTAYHVGRKRQAVKSAAGGDYGE